MFKKLSLLVLVMAFGLAFSVGCKEESAPPTVEEAQDAADKAGDAAKEAADEASDAAKKAGDAAKEAAEEGAEEAEKAADEARDALNNMGN